MRSLSLKLVMAFLFVGLAGVVLMVLVTRWSTFNHFDNFLFDRGREGLISNLGEYYDANGDWDELQGVFPQLVQFQFAPQSGPRERAPYTLVDLHNVVVIAGKGLSPGERVSDAVLEDAIPVEVKGKVVGWLLVESGAFRRGLADSAFLNQLTTTLLLSALGASLLALLLGAVLARTITRPLRELTTATKAVAAGDLDQKVPVRSKDELGELADSFNVMSAELSHAQQLRGQMTADIAHELRTPISIIIGHTDAIDEDVLPPSKETFNIIRDEAGRLERMVEDLRMLSRADAGELHLDKSPIDVQPLLEQVVKSHYHAAARCDIKLATECEPDLAKISVDTDRISMVLGNLLNNAIRYTPEGGIITLSAQSQGGNVEIIVTDNGPGIPEDEITRVFDRFYRIEKSRYRDDGGSGLGLAIAKSIVEQHGGKILVESVVGEGTSFIILLPEHTDVAG
jgi:signal transduction histidine kinase